MSDRKKVAIVTGGSRGIGYAIAESLISNGYQTCILGQRPEAQCNEALAPLHELGEMSYWSGSIADESDRARFVDGVIQKYGRIDVLVNNAGVAPKVRNDILQMTEDSFDYVVGTNLKGTLLLTQRVANAMLAQPKRDHATQGVIINISSFSSSVASVNRAEYCVSKAGISMVTKLFASRLAQEGILVYEIQPGIIETDMTAGVKEKYDRILAGPEFPIHRWGQPEDVARAVMMFANGEMRYSTGQVLHVDGGYMDVRSL